MRFHIAGHVLCTHTMTVFALAPPVCAYLQPPALTSPPKYSQNNVCITAKAWPRNLFFPCPMQCFNSTLFFIQFAPQPSRSMVLHDWSSNNYSLATFQGKCLYSFDTVVRICIYANHIPPKSRAHHCYQFNLEFGITRHKNHRLPGLHNFDDVWVTYMQREYFMIQRTHQ